jgi:hypothetical protein
MSPGMNYLGCRAMGDALIQVLKIGSWNGSTSCSSPNILSKSLKNRLSLVGYATQQKPDQNNPLISPKVDWP